jgi:ribosomal protein S18 acetylase RimI-like enzyme
MSRTAPPNLSPPSVQMEIRNLRHSEIEQVRLFLCAQGWAHRVHDQHAFERLIANTQRTAVAIVEGKIVGFARGITDDVSNGYLSMVAVASDFRRRGIGRALVSHVMGEDKNLTWVLRAGREDANAFFSSLGFVASTLAMERVRQTPDNIVE